MIKTAAAKSSAPPPHPGRIDRLQKPWLLEVNTSPALGTDCETDELVKAPLLMDLFADAVRSDLSAGGDAAGSWACLCGFCGYAWNRACASR